MLPDMEAINIIVPKVRGQLVGERRLWSLSSPGVFNWVILRAHSDAVTKTPLTLKNIKECQNTVLETRKKPT